jgi:hypothetical protein
VTILSVFEEEFSPEKQLQTGAKPCRSLHQDKPFMVSSSNHHPELEFRGQHTYLLSGSRAEIK